MRNGLLMLKNDKHAKGTVKALNHAWGEAFEHLAVGVAQFTLEGFDLKAERRLLHAQTVRRAGDVAFLGDGDEVAKMAQFHARSYTKSMIAVEIIYLTAIWTERI